MLKIEGKTFMNIQEAVQWLLENNALPFQCTANYQANTEIGLGTIVNPSPAKVRIGSLIFFADSKVSTVVGITETGFICSDQYNNLVDDIAYVTNVNINASGHLITTLSNGQTIDAGIVKQVSGFSIDASQHLIVTYNDGTSTDLGAIFSGNITISGNLTVTGGISGNAITGDSIIENMSGYSYNPASSTATRTLEDIYAGVVKNGNKLTLVLAFNATLTSGDLDIYPNFVVPASVANKLFPTRIKGYDALSFIDVIVQPTESGATVNGTALIYKSGSAIVLNIYANSMVANTKYYIRIEQTFLLSENLAS